MVFKKILAALALIALLPFFFQAILASINPTPQNIQAVAVEGSKAMVDAATPWWLPTLQWGAIGAIIFVAICVFAPKLLKA